MSPMRSMSPNPSAFGDATSSSTAAVVSAPVPTRRRLGGYAAAPVSSPSIATLPPPAVVQPAVVPSMSLFAPTLPPVGVVKMESQPASEPINFFNQSELAYYSAAVYGVVPPPPPAEEPKVSDNFVAPEPPKKTKKDLISRIKLKESKYDPSQKATFAPLPENIAPKDKVAEEETADNGSRLAIEGSNGHTSSMALALRDGAGELMKVGKNENKASSKEEPFKKKKKVKAPKEKRPMLNTPQALAAAEKAGAINDQMQAVQSQNEEATIASQENVEIRGNDARHLLMHKLMRTNRSAVIVIKNMVTAEEVDDQLDDEIRSECSKHGSVIDIVLAQDEDSTEAIRVFVRFAEPTQAEAARAALDKRFFAGRVVSASSYDQSLFEHGDYTG